MWLTEIRNVTVIPSLRTCVCFHFVSVHSTTEFWEQPDIKLPDPWTSTISSYKAQKETQKKFASVQKNKQAKNFEELQKKNSITLLSPWFLANKEKNPEV